MQVLTLLDFLSRVANAENGYIFSRKRTIEKMASRKILESECAKRGFHIIETGTHYIFTRELVRTPFGQFKILC